MMRTKVWFAAVVGASLVGGGGSAVSEDPEGLGPEEIHLTNFEFDCGTQAPGIFLAQFLEGVARGEVPDPSIAPLPEVAPRQEPLMMGVGPLGPDDLFLFEDTAGLLLTNYTSAQLNALMVQAANAVLAAHGDNFDFIGFWMNFDADHQTWFDTPVAAFHLPVFNDVSSGIGLPAFDIRYYLGLASADVEGYVMMWNIDRLRFDNTPRWEPGDGVEASFTRLLLAHEFEHRFAMFLPELVDGRQLQGDDTVCGGDDIFHWYEKVDGQGSALGIREWFGVWPAELVPTPTTPDGTCVSNMCFNADIGGVFSYADLYLMGYQSGDEMDAGNSEFRYMNDSDCRSDYFGPITAITSANIIEAAGPRIPNSTDSQKHFATAWVMIHQPGDPPTPAQLEKAAGILEQHTLDYKFGTLELGTMCNVLGTPTPITFCRPPGDNLPLLINGTSGDDNIRFALQDGNPAVVEVFVGNMPGEPHNLADFDSIHVNTFGGEDLVVFDDVNGAVAWLCPLDINLGNEDDKFVGGTGSLSIQAVLDFLDLVAGASELTDQVNTVLTLLGVTGRLRGPSGDMISEAVTLLKRIRTDFVEPAAVFVQDFKTTLIDPVADEVIATREGLITQAAALIIDAEAGLAADAVLLMENAKTDLELGAEDLVAEAKNLRNRAKALHKCAVAQGMFSPDSDPTSPTSAETLINEIEKLANELDPLLNDCDQNEPFVVGSNGEHIDDCPPNEECPDVCPNIEGTVDCMVGLIEDFERLAALCECEADQVAEDGEILAMPVLETVGEVYAAQADETEPNTLAYVADALVADGDALVVYAEQFAADLQSMIEDAVDDNLGNGLAVYAQTHFVDGGATYQDDVIRQIGGKAKALESEAALLMADLRQIVSDAQTILDSGIPNVGHSRNTDCSSIVTTNTINGGSGKDKLLGTLGNDLIHGNGDNDTIVGWAGDDLLYGDDGSDVILGWLGTNKIFGGNGADILVGGFGVDCIYGEDGTDLIVGLHGDDHLEGGMKSDIVIGNNGDDLLRGGEGIDLLIGDLSLPPDPGNDTIYGDDGFDVLIGGDGDDHMYGGPGQHVSILGVSIDLGNVMLGGGGSDVMYGEDDDLWTTDDKYIDVMLGGNEDGDGDQMHGGNGGDLDIGTFHVVLGNVMLGQNGDDTITSKDGFDVLFGGAGKDNISAGQGTDVSIGVVSLALGDLLFGGEGDDCLHGDGEWGVPPCNPVEECCAVAVNVNEQDMDLLFGGKGNDTMRGYDGGDLTIDGVTIMIGNLSFGGEDNDTIYSADGIDLAFGGSGDDTIQCGEGDEIKNTAGTFNLAFGDFIFGQGGEDTLHGDEPASTGGPRDGDIDVIFGGARGDYIYGGGGGEVYNIANPFYFVFGDLLFGGGGEDFIYGDIEQVNPNSRKRG
ncbi:MAG: calcium-binding protein, partial [Planctomycetes bacterium]|nr:calcium-binding protein [Planctomycetota bacterium]